MTHGLGGSETYTYDAVGNRKTVSSPTWVTGSQFYGNANPRNEYVTVGAATFTYDSLGNPIEAPTSTIYEYGYDALSRLQAGKLQGAPLGSGVGFTYDPRNRSVVRSVASVPTYAIYDEWNLIAEYDATGALKAKYIHGPRTDELLARIDTTGTRYFHENGLGSIVALTNETGAVVERYTYSAYGVPRFWNAAGANISASAQNNRFLFTGREWFKDARVYDYRSRAYSPYLGRFLQADPVGFVGGDANLYRYVRNSPEIFYDPLGTEWHRPTDHDMNYDNDGDGIVNAEDDHDGRDADGDGFDTDCSAGQQDDHRGPGNQEGGDPGDDNTGGGWIGGLQAGLTVVGLIPGVGEIADGLSGLVSLGQGDFVGAGLSLGAMVPIIGDAAGAAKLGRAAAKAAAKADFAKQAGNLPRKILRDNRSGGTNRMKGVGVQGNNSSYRPKGDGTYTVTPANGKASQAKHYR